MAYKTVDLRDQIPGDPVANQGAKEKTKGVVVHYNGAENGFAGVAGGELSVQQRYANDANDHIQRDWGEGARVNGVQYHYGCWEDTIYIFRNPDAKLWHCGDSPTGTEEDSYNYSATAVQVPISGATGDAPEDFEVPPNADEGARMLVNHWIAVLQLPDEPIGIPHGRYYVVRKVYASKPLIRRISQLGNGNWATDLHYAA